MVRTSNHKCVICFEIPSAYAFRQCGHQCLCENCWTDPNVEMLKCVLCGT